MISIVFAMLVIAVLVPIIHEMIIDYRVGRAFERAEQRMIDRIESGEYDYDFKNFDNDLQFEFIRSQNE